MVHRHELPGALRHVHLLCLQSNEVKAPWTVFTKLFFFETCKGITYDPNQGQTLANRTKPEPCFQVQMWACVHIDKDTHIIITASLVSENSALKGFRFSPVSFRAPRANPQLLA